MEPCWLVGSGETGINMRFTNCTRKWR